MTNANILQDVKTKPQKMVIVYSIQLPHDQKPNQFLVTLCMLLGRLLTMSLI